MCLQKVVFVFSSFFLCCLLCVLFDISLQVKQQLVRLHCFLSNTMYQTQLIASEVQSKVALQQIKQLKQEKQAMEEKEKTKGMKENFDC